MTFRVVQWATGNIGTRSLREVIRDPELELVGLVTYDPAKVGVDAGLLCGEGSTGVLATTDRVAARAISADCVVYMPRIVDVDDVLAMVEAGTNVVSTCVWSSSTTAGCCRRTTGHAWPPPARGAARRSSLRAAAPASSPRRSRTRCSCSNAASTRSTSRSTPTCRGATRRT